MCDRMKAVSVSIYYLLSYSEDELAVDPALVVLPPLGSEAIVLLPMLSRLSNLFSRRFLRYFLIFLKANMPVMETTAKPVDATPRMVPMSNDVESVSDCGASLAADASTAAWKSTASQCRCYNAV